ncbi:MAG: aminodeoxychorismate synthase component I [Proteobacteria bacterium]|nr:aminodeoxychorismate synthase component I [Pseudomonadota bacterium]
MAAFALLDDRHATREAPTSRLYEGHVRTHRCIDPAALDATWAAVDADLRAGLHAVVLADYEWGAKLLRAGHAGLAAGDRSALRVLMFERVGHLSQADATAWLAALEGRDEPQPAGTCALDSSVDRTAFVDAIERIHEAIRAGETYQVNYTYRLSGRAFGSPVALYRRLRERQPVAYGAFIALPDEEAAGGITHVLSCSPELFLRHDDGLLTARPMKGTAPRIAAPESDSETARMLSIDIKNRAENLMIVDLLRNDLGRLAEVGSVAVPALFAIEPYSTVFQMTSTVQARLRSEVGFPELLRAVFPCGSITGAPKHHTMELIAGLETTPRGLYCGAIGWLDAPRGDARIGNFCLSVAIRTATLGQPEPATGLRPIRLGIGAGIVIDSRAADEWDECRLKGRFLSALDPGFELFETMLWQPGTGYARIERHLARLTASAAALGFACDRAAIDAALARRALRLAASTTAMRVRLALGKSGAFTLVDAPLAPLPAGPVGLLIAEAPLPSVDPLRAHKTTARQHYDEGIRRAEEAGAFDSLHFDETGHLVEGGRSNVFLRLEGRWWTPPLADGVLPGVMRSVLLDEPAWQAAERTLTRGDLGRAEAIVVCNALRGALPARVVHACAALPAGA